MGRKFLSAMVMCMSMFAVGMLCVSCEEDRSDQPDDGGKEFVYGQYKIMESDHLFADEDIYLTVGAGGGRRAVHYNKDADLTFYYATSTDILCDEMYAHLLEYMTDMSGNEGCFHINPSYETSMYHAGDVVGDLFLSDQHKNFVWTLNSKGVIFIRFKDTPDRVVEIAPGGGKWIKATVDRVEHTITFDLSANDTGAGRVMTFVFYDYHFYNGLPAPCVSNGIRVAQAAE